MRGVVQEVNVVLINTLEDVTFADSTVSIRYH